MDLGINNRIAIVGGASKGIGRACAEALAREGARVTICARHADELEAAATGIRASASSANILPVAADLSQPEDIHHAVNETIKRWGHVDIVVNNVGGPPPGQPSALRDEQWKAGLELNFFSAVRLTRQVLPMMRQRKWGRVITILSLSIREPEDNLALSTVARTAASAYMKTLAREVAKDGITVNTILPGSIETTRLKGVAEMQARFHNRDVSHAMEDRMALIPAGRFGKPEEVGDLVAFLASDRAAFITGLNIPIDGGQMRGML